MPSNTQIEEALAPLVYSQLQDQLPELYKSLIGFQLIQVKEQGKKCLGIALFNIDKSHYAMPIFFINGFLKPLIMLFNYRKKTFIPATKDIVKRLLKFNPGLNVTLVPDGKYQSVLSKPNLFQFSTTPILSKLASYGKPVFANILVDILNSAHDSEPELKFEQMWKMASIPEKLNVLTAMQKSGEELIGNISGLYPDLISNISTFDMPTHKNDIVLTIKDEPSPKNSIEENKELYKGNIVIKDDREDTTEIIPKVISKNNTFGPPTENGVYEVINQTGKWDTLYMFPKIIDDASPLDHNREIPGLYSQPRIYEDVIIVNPKSRMFDCVKSGTLVANQLHGARMEGLIPLTSCEKDNMYIFINERSCTKPLCIHDILLNGFNLITMITSCGKITIHPRGEKIFDFLPRTNEYVFSPDILALKVECKEEYHPGTFDDLFRSLYVSSVEKRGAEYVIANKNAGTITKSGSYKECLEHLMIEENIHVSDATKMLYNQGEYIMVKNARSISPYPEPYISFNNQILPGRPSYPIPNMVATRDLIDKNRPVSRSYDMPTEGMSPDQEISFLTEASKLGNKEVIDASLIGVLARDTDDVERIKECVPVLNKATHYIAIALFSLWWRPENYSKDFTTDEMYELEQNLITLFKLSGDVALKFIQKKKLVGEN